MTCYQQAQNELQPYKYIIYPTAEWYKKKICYLASDRYYLRPQNVTDKNNGLLVKENRGLVRNKTEMDDEEIE
jgi:hypothetical protein